MRCSNWLTSSPPNPKTDATRGRAVQVLCTLELPRRGVTPRSERLVIFTFSVRQGEYLANGRDPMLRLSEPQGRGCIQGLRRNLSPSNPCSGRYLLLLFPLTFMSRPQSSSSSSFAERAHHRTLTHSHFVLLSAHSAFASSGLPISGAGRWKDSRRLHTR